ncbi:hypothetical protein BGLT_02671 [Caballeronia glathei]|uniref:Uncharacterized protein n=1 Tax=Caballeronia glathei TaxID=60547 RepID=A0A069PFV0_9BURK|nr:hypothetical protein [Caballeronia glathei]KDR39382.1 hypothetical protein BG61_33245 [Caballeronia glathei]CDY73254.1 hypothetical protein BGLT_02671 [Caballeronia glathei]
MIVIPSLVYLVLSLLVAYRGRRTRIGYFGTFLLSLFLTPVLVFVGLLLLTPSPENVEIVYRGDKQKV